VAPARNETAVLKSVTVVTKLPPLVIFYVTTCSNVIEKLTVALLYGKRISHPRFTIAGNVLSDSLKYEYSALSSRQILMVSQSHVVVEEVCNHLRLKITRSCAKAFT
jgi:hypothetical protein